MDVDKEFDESLSESSLLDGDSVQPPRAVSEWMCSLSRSVQQWLGNLAIDLQPFELTTAQRENPLYRYLYREFQRFYQLHDRVVRDLREVQLACEGDAMGTQKTRELRQIMRALTDNQIPSSWSDCYVIPKGQSR